MVFLEIYGVVVIFKFEGVFGVDIIEDGMRRVWRNRSIVLLLCLE